MFMHICSRISFGTNTLLNDLRAILFDLSSFNVNTLTVLVLLFCLVCSSFSRDNSKFFLIIFRSFSGYPLHRNVYRYAFLVILGPTVFFSVFLIVIASITGTSSMNAKSIIGNVVLFIYHIASNRIEGFSSSTSIFRYSNVELAYLKCSSRKSYNTDTC